MRDAAHDRPFAGVAVAAAAEHNDERAARIRPQGGERLGQRVRLVRVVDKDRRAVARAGQFETAFGAGEFFQRSKDAGRIGACGNGQSGGDRGVLHLEAADQRQLYIICVSAVRDLDSLRETVDRTADESNVVTALADRHDFQAARLRRRDHLSRITIVDIDDGGAARRDQVGKQPQLGGKISLDRRMIIEMVTRQIRIGAGGDAHAVEAVLVETVRRRFQGEMRDALAGQTIERAMQFDRVRRGQRTVFLALRRDDADGADAGGLQAERRPDFARERGDRSLAAGAGDGNDRVRLAREKCRGGERQSASRIVDRNESNAGRQSVRPMLAGNRRCAGGGGLGGELRAVGLVAGNGDEQKAGLHLAAVGGHAGRFDRAKARVDASAG